MERLRVYYVEKQRLRASDLESEQEYLVGLDQRHALEQHRPGIVRGLEVRPDDGGGLVVEPGIAIDSEGRELLLHTQESVSINEGEGCIDVWLIYCREPVRLPKPGRAPCSQSTYERWREIPRVISTLAGNESQPQAPAESAVFLGRFRCEDRQEILYAGLRGGIVADAGGRAIAQIGPREGLDPYGFVVNVADQTSNLIQRIAMDRRGNTNLSGTVEIINYPLNPVIAGAKATPMLIVESRRAEENVTLKLAAEKSQTGEDVIKMTISSDSGGHEEFEINARIAELKTGISDINRDSRLVKVIASAELMKLITPKKIRPRDKKGSDKVIVSRLLEVRDIFRPAMPNWQGVLKLDSWPERGPVMMTDERGCHVSDDPAGVPQLNGLSLETASPPPKDTPVPRVYNALVESDNRTIEQVRFDLGEKKESDSTTRFSLGALDNESSEFAAWMTVSGTCLVSLLDSDAHSQGNPVVTIDVNGTVEQSPMKPNPADPLYRDLLAAAWMAGLRSSILASTTIGIEINGLPALMESNNPNKPWSYNVVVSNGESKEISVNNLYESRIVGAEIQTQPKSSPFPIQPNSSVTRQVNHTDKTPAGDLTIQIMATGIVGQIPWWKSGEKKSVVVETPEADLSGFPDSVPPSTDWDYGFTVKNLAERGLTLRQITLTEEGGAPVDIPIGAPDLSAHTDAVFGPFPHPGITDALNVTLSVKYEWQKTALEISQDPSIIEGEIGAQRSIRVTNQLLLSLQAPASITQETPWQYSLAFINAGNAPLMLKSLKQRLTVEGVELDDFEDIPNFPQDPIGPGQSAQMTNIAGIEAPADVEEATLEILAEYRSKARIWSPPSFTQDISVTEDAVE